MVEMYCANEECRWHKEHGGGRFSLRGGQWYCQECARSYYAGEPGKNLWEFETANISGKAGESVKVKNLAHLRQLEKKHGVISVAANFDSPRWNRAGGKQ